VILGFFKAGYAERTTDAVQQITGQAPRTLRAVRAGLPGQLGLIGAAGVRWCSTPHLGDLRQPGPHVGAQTTQ
jgi:hypothetical protein